MFLCPAHQPSKIYKQFVMSNKLIKASPVDIQTSLPNLTKGLKEQRKIIN